jgi:hypothetical protein
LVRVVSVNKDGERVEVEVTKIDFGAATRALELLGKELMMFIDRHEVGSAGAFDSMSDEALAAALVEKMTELGLTGPGDTKH